MGASGGPAGHLQVQYLQTGLIPADGLTKILLRYKLSIFVKLLHLAERPEVDRNQKHEPRPVDCLDDSIAEDTTNH